jgi:hypothetical protein
MENKAKNKAPKKIRAALSETGTLFFSTDMLTGLQKVLIYLAFAMVSGCRRQGRCLSKLLSK